VNDSDCLKVRPTFHHKVRAPRSNWYMIVIGNRYVSIVIDLKPLTIGGLECGTISVARCHENCDRTPVRGRPL